jgi:hypothetical protein
VRGAGWRLGLVAALALLPACSGGDDGEAPTTAAPTESPLRDRPLPPPVSVRDRPEAALADPAFEPLPGARADAGRLGGAVYRIEVPEDWNGRLLLWMHGFEEFEAEAEVTAPDFRRFLIGQGFAWGASSFSSTSLIPGRAADETAALWDHFVRRHGRPTWTYVSGLSMGGWATHIAAERYGDRFDGALGLCGAVGTTPALSIVPDFVVAGAAVAGVTQAELDTAPSIGELIEGRILPALAEPRAHERFEDLIIGLTGGPRAFDREGIHLEEETNWRRAGIQVGTGLVPRRDPHPLGPEAVRLRTDDSALRRFTEGMEVTGELRLPLLTLHTTGDGQVPIGQVQALQRRVTAAGAGDRLVPRVVEDPGHCGFTTGEQEAALADLVEWVEHGRRPAGTDVAVDDLRDLDRTFAQLPRAGTPGADEVPGAGERVVLRGRGRLDGAPFDARFTGAVIVREGLSAACQYTLQPIVGGRFELTVLADEEASGCGRPGSEILLWTFVDDERLFATEALPWPGGGRTDVEVDWASGAPQGAAAVTTDYNGELYGRDGRRVPPGTQVEARVGRTRCGVASTRRTGSFEGYVLTVAGPDAVSGCRTGAPLTFLIDGRHAVETAVNGEPNEGALDLTAR